MATVQVGGRDIEVLPLNLKSLKQVLPMVRSMRVPAEGDSVEGGIDQMLSLVEVLLKRGNPDITRDWLEENLSVAELMPLLQKVMAASGFIQTGEAVSTGEVTSP